MEDMKERFLSKFHDNIKRDGAEDLLAWLSKSDFFEAPASTKFHGNYDGGLLEHSLNVYDALKKRVDEDEQCDAPDESVAIVALLHDLCKVNFYKKTTKNVKVDGQWTAKEVFEIDERFPIGYHADKSVILIQQFMRLLPEEMLAIRAHMGGFDEALKGGAQFVSKIFDRSRLAVHLHIADMEASYLKEERDV